ncbi:MAG TPA: TlyA family RNA methyltransferase [Acidimicrobiia bacterium]
MRRRLDAELVRRGLARSRADAVEAVQQGRVTVGGAPADNPARQVSDADPIERAGEPSPYVSRGGLKLAAALDAFAVEVSGGTWLDAGASTGGFTDCLLQRGAACVHAVDVGHGQLAWSLQRDPRVVVHDRTNVRNLEPDDIGGPVDGCVADLSFISLRTVAPALVRCTRQDGDFVLLVKPQFEAGRSRVGKGGVIRDRTVHAAVLLEVAGALAEQGLVTVAAVASPIHGADGNREFLFHARGTGPQLAVAALEALAAGDTTGDIAGNVTQPGGPSGENASS